MPWKHTLPPLHPGDPNKLWSLFSAFHVLSGEQIDEAEHEALGWISRIAKANYMIFSINEGKFCTLHINFLVFSEGYYIHALTGEN